MRNYSALALPIILFAVPFCHAETSVSPTMALNSQVNSRSEKSIPDLLVSEAGELQGRVVDRQGKPLPNVSVSLLSKRVVVATVQSDAVGEFSFRGVKSGLVMIRANQHMQSVRVWRGDIAPPNAKPALLLVAGAEAIRAQCCAAGANCGGCDACGGSGFQGHFGGVFQRVLQNPWLVGVGTAAAIAIPIAVGDDDEQASDFQDGLVSQDAS